MPDQKPLEKSTFSADWLLRGALTRIGDSFDRLLGRRWTPSSSLAASELIERIKVLLDAEAKDVPGKGKVVPHSIKLKMQWNKFAEGDGIETLRTELLTATVDHINDSLYYTEAPVDLEIKPDYFIEGVKLYVSFDNFDEGAEVEQNITVPVVNTSDLLDVPEAVETGEHRYLVSFEIAGSPKQTTLTFSRGQRRSVGRTAASDLALNDSSVSKIHASLMANEEGDLSVADTGSTNGTFVNNTRIAYGKAVLLAKGDRVKFGEVTVRFDLVPKVSDGEQQ